MATIKSIEEKARAYDEAIERAKDYKNDTIHRPLKVGENIMDYIFPELKESEDERIRNRLIAMCKHYIECYALDPYNINGYKEALAWLEKQGKNNMGISEATKQKLEDSLNEALEKETPESWNKFLNEQGEQKPADKIELRQEELTEFEKAVKQVLKEAIECGDTHNLKADADMLLRLVQKPWSEEDEMRIRELESLVKQVWATAEHENDKDTIHKMSDLSFFLKTLKPQLKQEWSEEDEKILNLIIACLHSHPNVEAEEYGKDYHWLKSLKDRYTWRPSYEQVSVLEFVMKDIEKDSIRYRVLNSVLEQLKKLREE